MGEGISHGSTLGAESICRVAQSKHEMRRGNCVEKAPGKGPTRWEEEEMRKWNVDLRQDENECLPTVQ